MTKNKATILSTGTLNGVLTESAAAYQIGVDVVPFIATEAVSADVLKEQVWPVLPAHTEVVFTSARAVESVASCLNGHLPHWKIFCIGHATREGVERIFGNTAVAATADNGVALAKAIIALGSPKEVVFFCGDQRRDELPDMLRGAGITVREIVAYRTIAVPQKINSVYDGVLFFSPSAVHGFFSVNAVQPSTLLFSIGPTTTGTLKKYCNNRIIESDQPTRRDVLNKVIEQLGR